ncbi:unnamed protein product, partial [Mesorhabditis spiculigera]
MRRCPVNTNVGALRKRFFSTTSTPPQQPAIFTELDHREYQNPLLAPHNQRYPFPGNVNDAQLYHNQPTKKKTALEMNTTSLGELLKRENAAYMDRSQAQKAPESLDVLDDAEVELTAQQCPRLLKRDLKQLFPNMDLSKAHVNVVNLSQYSEADQSAWTPEMEAERDKLTANFITAATAICQSLEASGYWADFVDPASGRPYFGQFTNATLFETDPAYQQMGFQIEDLGCCKVLKHIKWGSHAFVGTIFTDAPLNCELMEALLEDKPMASTTKIASYSQALPKAEPLDDELPKASRRKENLKLSTAASTIALDRSSARRKRPADTNLFIPESEVNLSAWHKMEPRGLLSAYLQLSKSKLTLLITSTAAAGYLVGTSPIEASTLIACAAGTALLSSAANACNQLLEAPYDAQMKRTQSRVLVVHRFSPLHALTFAGVANAAGFALLYNVCNPLAAWLGALNFLLYVGAYTPLKRIHISCTWAGALVGALPPLMGYAASTGSLDAASLTLAAILFSWQFPHFNGLSWNLRPDYSKAGYRVMCVTDERLCRVTSLRHSLALIGLCSIAAPLSGLTTISFALDTLPVNAYLAYLSYKFYKTPDSKNSRRLFFYSLLYLPVTMLLMVIGAVSITEEERQRGVADRARDAAKWAGVELPF